MSDLTLTITDAGRAALVNAQANGTAPVLLAQCGVSATSITPTANATSLPDEIKRIVTISGDVTDPATISITIRDESSDVYSLRSIAFYLDDGTLFALHGQATPIMEKSAQALLLLAVDIRFEDIDASTLTFGDTNFLNPAATTERQGVVELATPEETDTGADDTRAVTPKGLKSAFLSWINARFGRVDNTNDAEKPISTATQAALNDKVDKASAVRPGVDRLYRGDDNTSHAVKVGWDGARWLLRGYDAAGAFHAECRVAYSGFADVAGTVNWASVANRPTALSQFTNDTGFIDTNGRAYGRKADGTAINFYWVGMTDAPEWIWGGYDGVNMYAYSPSKLPISTATQIALNNKVDKASAVRPGVDRLYRSDNDDTGHSVKVGFDGARWLLRGYDAAGGFHAECRVAYSDFAAVAGTVNWASVANRPTALSQFENDTGFINTNGRAYGRKADGDPWNLIWAGKSSPPGHLLGSEDGISFYAYSPSLLSVSYASAAGNADTVDGYHASDLVKYADFTGDYAANGYVRLPGNRLLQWASISVGEDSYFTWTFPIAMTYCAYAAAEGMGQTGNNAAANNNPRFYSWSGTKALGYNPQEALTVRCFAIGFIS